MSVRVKLFGAMAVLVFFMGVAYFSSTQGYLRHNLPALVSAAEQVKTERWINSFQAYYAEHGKSWVGVDQNFWLIAPNETNVGGPKQDMDVALFSVEGKLLYKTAGVGSEDVVHQGLMEPIKVDGRTVGTLYFYNQELIRTLQLQQSIYNSMFQVALKVVGGMSIITLLIGFWLSRILTSPLRQLTAAIGRISKGDLSIALPVITRDEYGKVTAALNQMAASLARSEEVRKHLVADVTHELRTPLTILQGKFELIQQSGQAVAPETLLPMQDEVLRLSILVDDLHQLSLAEAGKLPLEKKKTDLHELLNRLSEIFRMEAEEKGVQLNLTSSAEDGVLVVDSHRITQVFYNLVGNAIRYTPSGGQVSIHLAEKMGGHRNDLLLSITDTGIGIPVEHLPYLFNRFYRVEDDRSRHSGGMGLGLAIAKQFVEAHGGHIEVISIVGKGTTFIVSLPRGMNE